MTNNTNITGYTRFTFEDRTVYSKLTKEGEVETLHAVRVSPQGNGTTLVDVAVTVISDIVKELSSKYEIKGKLELFTFLLDDEGFMEMSDFPGYDFYELEDCEVNDKLHALGVRFWTCI